jgi:UDP-glucuronate decarboxylase
MVQGLIRLMNTPDDFTGPVNLGNPAEFTIRQLAEKVIALTASTSKVVRAPLPSDDPRQRQPDIALARKVLGWEPATSLEAGLPKTIAYFEEVLRRPSRPETRA